MTVTPRPGAERLRDRCQHGLRMDPDPNVTACLLCRRELGDVVLLPQPPRPRPGYCGVPGHEMYRRGLTGCYACNAETAEHRAPAHRPDPDAPLRRAAELNRP